MGIFPGPEPHTLLGAEKLIQAPPAGVVKKSVPGPIRAAQPIWSIANRFVKKSRASILQNKCATTPFLIALLMRPWPESRVLCITTLQIRRNFGGIW
jgi:hypothetical protein